MKTYTATFLPENKTVTAVKGKSLLEAAAVAGIRINSICAGDGVCGKCRVLVKSGKVTAKPNMFLTRREIQRGMALACQTYVAGDVIVEVPLESRSGAAPILAPEDALRYGRESEWIDDEARFRRQPLSRKLFVELPPPTLDDALCDQERLFRELRKHQDIPVMQMGLTILKQLPAVLRDSDWKITVLLGRRGDTLEVVDIEAGDTTGSHFGLAVDLGTTTLVAQLVDLCNGATVSTQAKYNSQAACGEDVIARMMCANDPARREELKQMVVDDINDLLNALLLDSGAKAHDVTYV
ncbi:MAG: 2Fe-2S iron-sulfur cluster binding domain-containing protein, partial [Verrucomicrobia bacterium]|nr:2Fe-2S iron-sulfur cluster binding domain-containing protein [Verrucomicrobiota bacterium]